MNETEIGALILRMDALEASVNKLDQRFSLVERVFLAQRKLRAKDIIGDPQSILATARTGYAALRQLIEACEAKLAEIRQAKLELEQAEREVRE